MKIYLKAGLLLVLALVPLHSSKAITQAQINAEVQIVCPDNYGNWFSGSGTIIDPKGIILTNKHVVTDQKGGIIQTCFIGFVESINREPNFGSKENPNLAEVKYYTTTSDMDATILYLNNPTNTVYPHINIWDSNSDALKFGDKLEVMGFPSIGGSTVTYTSGDFSGFGSKYDGTQNYIKTTAILEHGNSGGSAYNTNGQFTGIPSMVVTGPLNSISYALSVNSIKSWLSGILGSDYKQEVLEQKPIITEPPKVDLQNDITPPNFNVLDQLCYYIFDSNKKSLGGRCFPKKLSKVEEFNHIQFEIYKRDMSSIDSSGLKKIYYYFDQKIHSIIDDKAKEYIPTSINNDELSITDTIDIDKEGRYYFTFFGEDNFGNISNPYVYEYAYEKNYFKKIRDIAFFRDKNYKQSLGKYNFKFVEADAGLGKAIDDELTCKTRLDNIYFKWDYPIELSKNGYVVDVTQSSIFPTRIGKSVKASQYFIQNIKRGKKSKDVYYRVKYRDGATSAEGLDMPMINYNFYLRPIVNAQVGGIDIKHKIFSVTYDPKLKKDLVCISTNDIYNSFSLDNSSRLHYFDTINIYSSLVP